MSSFLAKMAIGFAVVFVGIGTVLGVQSQKFLFKRQTHFRADAGGRVPLWSLVATRGVFQCIEACTGDPRCMSVLYNSETKACLLHAEHVSSVQDNLAPADWQLLEKQVDGPPCPVSLGYAYRVDLGLCYKVHQDTLTTWSGADSVCQGEGGHLLVVDTQEKQDFMVAELTSIEGTTNFGSSGLQGFFLDGRYTQGGWTWSSRGQPVVFSAWLDDIDLTRGRDSIMMSRDDAYLWSSVKSSFTRPFVCEVDVSLSAC